MGQSISCDCIAELFDSGTIQALTLTDGSVIPDIDDLHRETKFQRKAYMGLSAEDIFVSLSVDNKCLSWKVPKSGAISGAWASISGNNPDEFGEVSLIDNIATIRATTENGFAVVDFSNKIIFEVCSEDVAIRDKWVRVLNELLQSWVSTPSSKPKKTTASAAGSSDKAAYFAMREQQIQDRKKLADERKKKYTAGGMKYTAIAMMNREN